MVLGGQRHIDSSLELNKGLGFGEGEGGEVLDGGNDSYIYLFKNNMTKQNV